MYLKEIQIAGLLHDFGKFIHKYNGNLVSHALLSELFILKYPEVCLGSDVELIASIVGNHHSIEDKDFDSAVGKVLESGRIITESDSDKCKKVYNDFNTSEYKTLKDLLSKADTLSASVDRKDEGSSRDGSGTASYAPLWSPIADSLGQKLAIKSGKNYQVYRFVGDNDKKETVLSKDNDPDFSDQISFSEKNLYSSFNTLSDVNSLDTLLSEYWVTVNANTWRLKDSQIGHSTTSLYDHSKTTAAIAGCLYINRLAGIKYSDSNSGIDVVKLCAYNTNVDTLAVAREILLGIGLFNCAIIGGSQSEVYFIFPNTKRNILVNKIREYNRLYFTKYEAVIDMEIAENWDFKSSIVFADRFNAKYYGIKDVLDLTPNSCESNIKVREDKSLVFSGFIIHNYEKVLEGIGGTSGSISKLATAFRIYETFQQGVASILEDYGCKVLIHSLDRCIFICGRCDLYHIHVDIAKLYKKYVLDVDGVLFISTSIERYSDALSNLSNSLVSAQNKKGIRGQYSYTKIGNYYFPVYRLAEYFKIIKEAKELNNSNILYKLRFLLSELSKYKPNSKNASSLMSIPRMYNVRNKYKDNDKAMAFIDRCISDINKEGEINKENVVLYITAINDAF